MPTVESIPQPRPGVVQPQQLIEICSEIQTDAPVLATDDQEEQDDDDGGEWEVVEPKKKAKKTRKPTREIYRPPRQRGR